MPDLEVLELAACQPDTIELTAFNPVCVLPYGLMTEHVRRVMSDFLNFLGFVNLQLHGKGLKRLETLMMQANFSSIVSEYMKANLPHYCKFALTSASNAVSVACVVSRIVSAASLGMAVWLIV